MKDKSGIKKQNNEDLTLTRYSSAHLDRAEAMAENVWHLVHRASTGACSIDMRRRF